MKDYTSCSITNAIHLGVAIFGWYRAISAPEPDPEPVKRSVRMQLDICGFSNVTLPRTKDARFQLLGEIVMRVSAAGDATLASAVRLGWVLFPYDGQFASENPETLKKLFELAEKVGITEESIRLLMKERKSICDANHGEVLIRHIDSWSRPEDPISDFEFDVFISYASEDRDSIAKPIYDMLIKQGLRVWFDKFELELGDSLRRKIDCGLAHCRFGIVILSPNFLKKEWPQVELDGLMAREIASGKKAILPVWHEIDAETLNRYSPILGARLAARTENGIPAVVEQVLRVVSNAQNG